MTEKAKKFTSQIPKLNLAEDRELLTDFSREAQRHLISARNSLLVLESVPTDKEAVDNIFKTFHTIKGLADFLDLNDICFLTATAERVMDTIRKGQLDIDPNIHLLIVQTVDNLQKLLELLDDQIESGGDLHCDYLDISQLIINLQGMTEMPEYIRPVHKDVKIIPTIHFEPDMTSCSELEKNLDTIGSTSQSLGTVKKLIQDFKDTTRELKEAQGKLQERQRELIHERELAIKLTQQAQKEARAKSEYLANVSHEIRTLINAILGFTELLNDGTLSAKQKEHLNTIIMSGKTLLGIVNDILDFSKVESGKLKLEQIDLNIRHVIEEVFKILRTRVERKPIRLFFDVDQNVPEDVLGDPTRMKQIFINLLDNALKFTEKGDVGLSVKIDPAEYIQGDTYHLRFTVSDTGIGIPENRKKAIFDSFTQAEDSTTRIYGGSGLGLALCKTFVENMKGTIWVESELKKGSQFQFVIPFKTGKSTRPKPDFSVVKKFTNRTFMLVSDDERTFVQAGSALEALGFKISLSAKSAKQAVEKLDELFKQQTPLPEFALIDANLENKEAFMLSFKIQEQDAYRSMKRLALSSDIRLETTPEYSQAGFTAVLFRPIILSELSDLILRLMGDQSQEHRILTVESVLKISCEGLRVLVVEDSLPNQELLKVHFDALGCVCDYANNGQEAIDLLKKNQYDICFMDLQMPVMGGLDATKAIRNDLKLKIPVIALTAAEIIEEKEHCLEAGMTDYLPKPFDAEILKQKLVHYTKM